VPDQANANGLFPKKQANLGKGGFHEHIFADSVLAIVFSKNTFLLHSIFKCQHFSNTQTHIVLDNFVPGKY